MTWQRVCTLADLPVGETRAVRVGDDEVLVCHVAPGELHVVSDLCTHDDGPLGDGILDGHEVICPRHGARFDVTTGRAVRLPAVGPLATYPVRVEDGWIEVEVEP